MCVYEYMKAYTHIHIDICICIQTHIHMHMGVRALVGRAGEVELLRPFWSPEDYGWVPTIRL